MFKEDFNNKTVLDMGCGTGILAILADKLNAKDVTAIDYDQVCYDSTIENASLNNATRIVPLCGSKEVIPEKQYDIILANINRNILLDQMLNYAEVLVDSGTLLISGFYETYLQLLSKEAETFNLSFIKNKVSQNWTAAKFIKRK